MRRRRRRTLPRRSTRIPSRHGPVRPDPELVSVRGHELTDKPLLDRLGEIGPRTDTRVKPPNGIFTQILRSPG